ncbi:hypothetical protein HDV05_007554 [Chytridiales sp. JEL 0842]|nr:hypothetical protein HDV05_007554 [Chytridiales sp. JEL 0842]
MRAQEEEEPGLRPSSLCDHRRIRSTCKDCRNGRKATVSPTPSRSPRIASHLPPAPDGQSPAPVKKKRGRPPKSANSIRPRPSNDGGTSAASAASAAAAAAAGGGLRRKENGSIDYNEASSVEDDDEFLKTYSDEDGNMDDGSAYGDIDVEAFDDDDDSIANSSKRGKALRIDIRPSGEVNAGRTSTAHHSAPGVSTRRRGRPPASSYHLAEGNGPAGGGRYSARRPSGTSSSGMPPINESSVNGSRRGRPGKGGKKEDSASVKSDVIKVEDILEEIEIADDTVPMTVEMECPDCGLSEMVDAGGVDEDVV